MDYSLLLGLHDCARAEQESRERAEREDDEDNHDEEDDSESGSGLESRGPMPEWANISPILVEMKADRSSVWFIHG